MSRRRLLSPSSSPDSTSHLSRRSHSKPRPKEPPGPTQAPRGKLTSTRKLIDRRYRHLQQVSDLPRGHDFVPREAAASVTTDNTGNCLLSGHNGARAGGLLWLELWRSGI